MAFFLCIGGGSGLAREPVRIDTMAIRQALAEIYGLPSHSNWESIALTPALLQLREYYGLAEGAGWSEITTRMTVGERATLAEYSGRPVTDSLETKLQAVLQRALVAASGSSAKSWDDMISDFLRKERVKQIEHAEILASVFWMAAERTIAETLPTREPRAFPARRT
jgi:hypothetical protein